MPISTKVNFTYADIADELNVTKSKLQSFVKWWQRNKNPRAFRPSGWSVSATAPQHYFGRKMAEEIKRAYITQRVEKAWKKPKVKKK